jgi:hypothetical protein
MSQSATVTVRVETRHLDTDERERSEFDVAPLGSEARERAQLIEIVAQVVPDAKIRSFANGAATFLGREHLVIAAYAEAFRTRRTRWAASQDTDQDSLFAA